jgi:hypothetical protein
MDGGISQIILFENSTAALLLFVSKYIQVIANIETKGIAANSAPTRELRFVISDISTIKNAVITIFVM